MDIANRLELLMKEKGINNKKQLAMLMDIPYSTLKNIFQGNASDIRLSTATKICQFFNITFDELFSENLDLSNIRIASYKGLNTEGLTVTDLKEVNDFIKYVKSKKKK